MKRSLSSTGQRRNGAEAPQLRPAPPRPAPGRHRPALQARAPLPGTDERHPAWALPAYSADSEFRSQVLNALIAASCDADEKQHQQAELARIRAEVMDVARDLAALRHQSAGSSAHDAMSNLDRAAGSKRHPVREPRSNATQAPVIRVEELLKQKQRIPAGRRHQIVEQPRRHGSAEPAILAAPTREQWPLLAIGDDVVQTQPVKTKTSAKPNALAAKVAVKTTAKTKDAAKPGRKRRLGLVAKAALFAALMLAGTAAIAITLQGKLPLLAFEPLKASRLFADSASPATEAIAAKPGQTQLASAADRTSALYPFEMPDTYGVYAVGDGGQLTALESLPIRIPDARVAISSAITKPEPAPVTNGTPLFVVYHRELANSVPENASVRVFAKVMRASTFVGGKPKAIPAQESWAVRGGAIDLRIAPVAANKEMILIRPADPHFTLSPGRYVMMFKNQAYDFSVAGTISDTAHCLERSDLQDGSVYSECRELPASAAKS